MSRAVILQHVEHEGPGRLMPVLRDFGIPVEIRQLHRGDAVPQADEELRALIVMGGPMGVRDVGDGRFPFLQAEVELLRELVAEDRPVLGICLGAQLLAHAAGAKVYANTRPGPTPESPPVPAPEIGWGPVSFPFPGGTEPIVMGLMDGVPMFHWHFDTFDVPKLPPPPASAQAASPTTPPFTGSALLCSTATCRNQAFRFKNRLFGFQFHFEMDQAGIEAMLAHAGEDLAKAGADAQAIRRDTAQHYARHERLGNRLIQNFVQFLKLY